MPGVIGNYNIWMLDTRTGALQQITKDPADDFMPTWSPSDDQIAFISTRGGGQTVWVITLSSSAERQVSPAGVRADAPSWGASGQIVYHATTAGSSRYEIDGAAITGDENVFPFRAAWRSATEIVYVSDGKIRKRTLGAATSETIPFSATLRVTKPEYTRRKRDFTSRAPRRVVGINNPKISPDGKQVAFTALGDLWVMPIGGKPVNLTNDRFLDADPAWSPDGSKLAWSSDRSGRLEGLWVRDMKTGQTQSVVTPYGRDVTSALMASWSPDGKRIAFSDVDGMWRRATLSVVDLETRKVSQLHSSLFAPGTAAWSPDGKRIAVTSLVPFSARFREGTNQILTMSSSGESDDKWFAPVPNLSIDSRVGGGPAWSPDGTKMAIIYEGLLNIVPVSPGGEPLGPPRRVTSEMAYAPSWAGDSRHVLYQSMDKLRLMDVETGEVKDVPVSLTYTLDVPSERIVVHAGQLVDGVSPTARQNVDIVIDGNRISSVVAHSDARHAGARVVDAGGLTVMPGLIEHHSHLQPDLGGAALRAWLAFGITTVRSPGGMPYEAAEFREASDAGRLVGPRVFSTGYLLEWQRVYYPMAVPVSNVAQLEMELQRAKALQFDLIKSYVRMPELQQRRIIEFAHAMGVPSSSHEVYPAAFIGSDGTEHITGTSRRGFSPKVASLQRSYDDVAQLWGKAQMTMTPTLALGGATLRSVIASDSSVRSDPRLRLYALWNRSSATGEGGGAQQAGGARGAGGGPGSLIMRTMRAGTRIVAGTDTPNAINLHAELAAYVAAGMTPFEALKTATVNPAVALNLDAGSIQVGKLADLAIVEGNPLQDINATRRVRRVIVNGRAYSIEELLAGPVQH
jgi:Tol biopolymer transport system component